jgi:hypothetical protein
MSLASIAACGLLGVNTNKNWFIPMGAPIEFSRKNFILDPYFIGALIANASIGYHHTSHHGDAQQRAAMQRVAPETIKVSKNKNKWAAGINNKVYTKKLLGAESSNIVTAEMNRLGLAGTESHTKFIPPEYIFGNVQQRLALLQGLMDNDGTVNERGDVSEYNTVSKRLADGVTELVRSLGGVARRSSRIPTYTYKGQKLNGQRDYRIRISMPDGLVPFRIKRKVDRFRPRTKYPPAHAIESIVSAGKKE